MKHIKRILSLVSVLTVLAVIGIGVLYHLFPLKYVDTIRSCSEEMGVDPFLVAALIKAESNYDSLALSKAQAKGVMQLTDETALFCAEKLNMEIEDGDIYKPEVNIKLGVYYLKRMQTLFNGDDSLAVAAYNAGEGRVREWLSEPAYSSDGVTLDVIPYSETEKHVEKINNYKKIYKLLYPNL